MIFLIMCGYLYAFLTPAGKAKVTNWYAWWNPYDFSVGIINGKALKRKKEMNARYLASRIRANKERVAKRQAEERAMHQVRPGLRVSHDSYRPNDLGGFHTGLPEVYVEITGGVMKGPDHLATRRSGAKLEMTQDDRIQAAIDEKMEEMDKRRLAILQGING
jgi:hypothetical protein